jgi:hypothetical protein
LNAPTAPLFSRNERWLGEERGVPRNESPLHPAVCTATTNPTKKCGGSGDVSGEMRDGVGEGRVGGKGGRETRRKVERRKKERRPRVVVGQGARGGRVSE